MYEEVNSIQTGGLLEKKTNNDRVIIVYHWNSCGHCRSFMPLLDNLMNDDIGLRDISNVFKVEYDNIGFLPERLRNVSAFPMIISYENGKKKEEFKEQRTIDNVKKFIQSNSSKSKLSSSLSSKSIKKQLKDYKNKKRVIKSK